MNIDRFCDFLRPRDSRACALPATSAELLDDCRTSRLAKLPGSENLPADANELSQALRALEVAGRIERRGNDWHWLPDAVKAEPQLTMF